MSLSPNILQSEWIEPDGFGGFASGTVSGRRSRRYHGLLLNATKPPSGRVMLVQGVEVALETPRGGIALSSHEYAPGVIHPDGHTRIIDFQGEPWPTWRFQADGVTIQYEIVVAHETGETLLKWEACEGDGPKWLEVRPLLSGRDYHALHRENPAFHFQSHQDGERIVWNPYSGIPAIQALSNGAYQDRPDWYRNFLYREEQDRGLDSVEDLASPGVFRFDLAKGPAVLIFSAIQNKPRSCPARAKQRSREILDVEASRRKGFHSPLDRAADAYIVRRGSGKTIVAGYPWFTDWGRDTFIALRGLCLARGELATARDILCEWAGTVSEGMLPNRFPDGGEQPEYNSVDASLWYIVAVHDFLAEARARRFKLSPSQQEQMKAACEAIVAGYSSGTRFGIRLDTDGLLAAGIPGVQLTWMDAKIGDWVVTPRVGKPVEVQALWINALRIVSGWERQWEAVADRATKAFATRFWNEESRCLFDVVDVHHVVGEVDKAIRPNQILAVGGLPFPVVDGEMARHVVDSVEAELLTPLGLRSLAPRPPAIAGNTVAACGIGTQRITRAPSGPG